MPSLLPSALALCCLGLALQDAPQPAPAPPASLTLHQAAIEPGSRFEVTGSARLEVTMSMPGEEMEMKTDRLGEGRRLLEVLAPGKVKVEYSQDADKTTMSVGGNVVQEQSQESLVEGKTYLAELKEGTIEVTAADGTGASEEEAQQVRQDVREMLEGNPLGRALGERELEEGKAVDLPPDLARELLDLEDEEQDIEIHKFQMTLQGTRECGGADCAAFATVIEAGTRPQEDIPGAMSMNLSGEMLVDRETCRVTGFELKGPIEFQVDPAAVGGRDLSGKGTITVSRTSKLLE